MTSPDIIDVDPYSTQSYNRYAYVVNNPMKYVDPSGCFYVLRHRWHDSSFFDRHGILTVKSVKEYYYAWFELGEAGEELLSSENGTSVCGGGRGSGKSSGGGGGLNPADVQDAAYVVSLEGLLISAGTAGNAAKVAVTTARFAGGIGGFVGFFSNGYDSYTAAQNGDYQDAAMQAAQMIAYGIATYGLFTPAAPVALILLVGLATIDAGEYLYKNW